jgi:vacuolar-type H+-ATPase subunit D/Vma8
MERLALKERLRLLEERRDALLMRVRAAARIMSGAELGHGAFVQPPPIDISGLFHQEEDPRPIDDPLVEITALEERLRLLEERRDTLLMLIRKAARELEL